MSRKAKILSGLLGLAVVLTALAFLRRQLSGDVSAFLIDGRGPDSTSVSFVVTNSFRRPVVYYLEGQVDNLGSWGKSTLHCSNYTGHISGCSTETISIRTLSPNRWRLVVLHAESWQTSLLTQRRRKLAGFARQHNWKRLSAWLEPSGSFIRSPGSEMVGNKPANSEHIK